MAKNMQNIRGQIRVTYMSMVFFILPHWPDKTCGFRPSTSYRSQHRKRVALGFNEQCSYRRRDLRRLSERGSYSARRIRYR